MRTMKLVGVSASFLVALLVLVAVVLLFARRQNPAGKNERIDVGGPAKLSTEPEPWVKIAALNETNRSLRQLSLENLEFQKWGRSFMLKVANDHLSKVPVFGLQKAQLSAGDVSVRTFLTLNGAEFELSTSDGKYAMYYDHGVLTKVVAHDFEMAALFYDPSRFNHLADNAAPWSDEEAGAAAQRYLQAKGMNPVTLHAKPSPLVRARIFRIPTPDGSATPVPVFYTVSWPDRDLQDFDDIEIELRRAPSGRWEPTSWFQLPWVTSDRESTSFTNLYARFFAAKR